MTSTIYALSTGMPPAAIAIVRISGPDAFTAVRALARSVPRPRVATLRALRDPVDGSLLDRAIIVVFPAPNSATGEDMAELQLHGGRAVVTAVQHALSTLPGLRSAEPGEFTRRALTNGRIDLAEAEGLGDLLTAETEAQRRAALAMSDGVISRRIAEWRAILLDQAARIEAAIDFTEEADVPEAVLQDIRRVVGDVAVQMRAVLAQPTVERLRGGIHVVIAGPPNSGKSTLLNALVRRDVAIVSPIAGTTRDRIETMVARDGIPFVLTDTAGLRNDTDDTIERIGMGRARDAVEVADLLLWLGDDEAPRGDAIRLHARCDLPGREIPPKQAMVSVSAFMPETIERVWLLLVENAAKLIPQNALALNDRQAGHCYSAVVALEDVVADDELIVADSLRRANIALARVTGDVALDDMLDALFARFCLGK